VWWRSALRLCVVSVAHFCASCPADIPSPVMGASPIMSASPFQRYDADHRVGASLGVAGAEDAFARQSLDALRHDDPGVGVAARFLRDAGATTVGDVKRMFPSAESSRGGQPRRVVADAGTASAPALRRSATSAAGVGLGASSTASGDARPASRGAVQAAPRKRALEATAAESESAAQLPAIVDHTYRKGALESLPFPPCR
jgi:hypothetical protein